MKYKSTRQNLHNHLHGVDSTEYVPGKKERFSSISLCTRQERFCFWKDKSDKTPKNTGVDKTRNMEHLGTFRNIPEHPGTWKNKNNFHEKKIIIK